ncbi:MAG: hypothetical protein ILP19_05740 [Oscillospiraceae bacterium]|nr:hypothetical protein [Oscillospiraceae bacterium]
MGFLKKAAAVLAVLLITLFGACAHVSAFEFDNAYELTSGKTIKVTLNPNETKYFKIVLTEKGELKIKSVMDASAGSRTMAQWIYLYDSEGNELCEWKQTAGSAGVATINGNRSLGKGTYYIKICRTEWAKTGSGTTKITVTFPSEAKADAKKTASASYPVIYMEKGDTVKLGALVSGKAASDVTVTSSKTDVAKTDSDGIVTAKAKGTSVITVKSGKTVVKVAVVVS